MQSILYIVATPIGNLADITLRAVEVLKSVDLILAEDTRVTKKLLNHYDIKTSILSYHQYSGEAKKEKILKLLLEGKSIALVTDAGTPGISDPGNELVDYINQHSPAHIIAFPRGPLSGAARNARLDDRAAIKIIPIPGPSAVTAALSICGFNISKYIFIGYFPRKKRTKLITWLKDSKLPFVFFESPHRIKKTLAYLAENLGEDRRIFIGRELTKLHEETFRGSLNQAQEYFGGEKKVKGEIVVVVEKLS